MMKLVFMLMLVAAVAEAANLPASFSGRSAVIGHEFAYYRNRSPESVAEEIAANGFDAVSFVAVSESGINGDLPRALVRRGLAVRIQTYGNGVYSRDDLPPGWEAWKMVLPHKSEGPPGFTYLCLNNREYREWKKRQVTSALNKHPFVGVDIAESFFPNAQGPMTGITDDIAISDGGR